MSRHLTCGNYQRYEFNAKYSKNKSAFLPPVILYSFQVKIMFGCIFRKSQTPVMFSNAIYDTVLEQYY